MAKGIPEGVHGYDKSKAQLVREAAEALSRKHSNGFTQGQVHVWLDEHYPRMDGRPWDFGMSLVGDHAVWSDNGEDCNDSADGEDKFLDRVSARNERPKRYRLRSTAVLS